MRTFIVLALLAFAFADSLDMWHAFNTEFGFTDVEIQHADACLINGVYPAVQQAMQLKSVLDIQGPMDCLEQFLQLAPGAVNTLENQCADYMNDWENYVLTQGTGYPLGYNVEVYAPEIIQKIALLVGNGGNSTQILDEVTEIIRIVIGTEVPQVPQAPEVDWDKVYSTNKTEPNPVDMINAYFGTLGLGDKIDASAIVQSAMGFANIDTTPVDEAYNSGDYQATVNATETVVLTFFKDLKKAEPLVDAYALIFRPVLSAFVANPVEYMKKTLYNTAANLPQIVEMSQEQQIDEMEGDYTSAMEISAQQALISLNGVVDFTQE